MFDMLALLSAICTLSLSNVFISYDTQGRELVIIKYLAATLIGLLVNESIIDFSHLASPLQTFFAVSNGLSELSLFFASNVI